MNHRLFITLKVYMRQVALAASQDADFQVAQIQAAIKYTYMTSQLHKM